MKLRQPHIKTYRRGNRSFLRTVYMTVTVCKEDHSKVDIYQ